MENQDLVDYVARNLAKGHNKKDLKRQLVGRGWSAASVDAAFKRYQKSRRAPKVSQRRYRHRASRGGGFKFALTLLVVIVAAGAVIYYTHHTKPQHRTVKVQPLTYAQKQSQDINTLAGAIGQYAEANGALPARLTLGGIPGTLVLCGTVCDASNSLVGPLLGYPPANVHLHPYVAGLSAPNIQTVYLVSGGSCQNHTSLGDPASNPRAMVILYAVQSGTTLAQHCLTL